MSALPWATRTATVGGLDYAYAEAGAGPPVVLVHGNPTWSYYFRSLLAALPPVGYRVLAPDHIGMGHSAKPSRDAYPYTLRRRIDDFAEFLESLDLDEPVTLVVHDWGGAIALGWAVEHPDRVARVVLMNTGAFPPPPGKRIPRILRVARSWPIGSFAVGQLNAFARAAMVLGVGHRMPADVRRHYLAPYDSPAHRVGILGFLSDIPLHGTDPTYQVLARVEQLLPVLRDRPVLICWGSKDFVFDDRVLARWQELFPAAAVHRYADAGHLVLEDASDRIVPLVREFLAATSASAPGGSSTQA